MTRLTTTLAAGLIAATAMAGTASAVSLSIVGGTAGSIPGGTEVNDALGPLGFVNPLGGFFGSSISLSGPANVTYTLLGWEAGFSNAFTTPGGSFSTEGNAGHLSNLEFDPLGIASISIGNVASGLLSFSFTSGLPGSVANGGANLDVLNSVNFFASFGGGGSATTGTSLYLFLDDAGGRKADGVTDDDNHDDLVVRVDVTPVPLPAGIWLFATALGGLGLLGRKRAAA